MYGLFLAKVVTIVVAIGAVVLLVVSQGMRRQGQRGELNLVDLGEQYKETQREMRLARMSHAEQKAWVKEFKKQEKADQKLKKQRAKSGAVAAVNHVYMSLILKGALGRRRSLHYVKRSLLFWPLQPRKMKCCYGWKVRAVWCMAMGWRLLN